MDGSHKEMLRWIDEKKIIITRVVFIFPIVLSLGFLLLKVAWNNVYVSIIQEDSIVENIQFLAYLSSSLLALFAGIRYLRKGYSMAGFALLLWAGLLLLVSLEEISWGQRILGISTFEWVSRHSAQNELTVHNLKAVQRLLPALYILAGLLLSFGWIPARHLPSCSFLRADVKAAILLLTPKWYLMPFFLPTVFINTYFCMSWLTVILFGWDRFKIGNFVIWKDQEPAELLLSLGCLMVVIIVILKQKAAHR